MCDGKTKTIVFFTAVTEIQVCKNTSKKLEIQPSMCSRSIWSLVCLSYTAKSPWSLAVRTTLWRDWCQYWRRCCYATKRVDMRDCSQMHTQQDEEPRDSCVITIWSCCQEVLMSRFELRFSRRYKSTREDYRLGQASAHAPGFSISSSAVVRTHFTSGGCPYRQIIICSWGSGSVSVSVTHTSMEQTCPTQDDE